MVDLGVLSVAGLTDLGGAGLEEKVFVGAAFGCHCVVGRETAVASWAPSGL